jgi:leucyl aminopeptidase (aminopeptidase T)
MSADLARALRTVMGRCLAVRAGESVLVICDPGTVDLGHALLDTARRLESDAVLVILPPHPARGTEPPATVAAALEACDVFIAPCEPSLSHTAARRDASARGARGATLPGVTADMLARLMGTDVAKTARRSRVVARLLTEADAAHVACPLGTDLRIDLTARDGIADDGDLSAPGAFGNLPCGEGYVAPVGGDGVVWATSIATIGKADGPVRLTVDAGRLAEASGPGATQLVHALTAHGERGRNLAELGVGTNAAATLTGNVLEDEKVLGTVHVAFGASSAFGGTVTVPVHIDAVIVDPTLAIGDTIVVENGRFLL